MPGNPVGADLTEYGRRIAEGARRPTPELLARLARILRAAPVAVEAPAAATQVNLPKAA